MTVIHLKKKDVVKSSVKGISIEFDHEQCVAILDVLEEAGICEYIEEAGRVRSVEMKPSRKVYSFYGNEKCDTSIWKRDTSKLLGFDIYGSLNGKE
ncbi:hypothetical protein Dimus_017859, partial [Dionaea muscipula]